MAANEMQPFSTEEFLRRYIAGLSARSAERALDIVYERVDRERGSSEFETIRTTLDGHEIHLRVSVKRPAVPERPQKPSAPQALEGELVRRTRLLLLLEDLALALREVTSAEEAVATTLCQVCDHLDWQVGHAYAASEAHARQVLEPMESWHVRAGSEVEEFRRQTMETLLRPGTGVVGRVFETGEPAVVLDLGRHPDWNRTEGPRSGLISGAFFPIHVGREVRIVLEFFSDQPIVEDPDLVRVMENVALQLGQFLKEKEVERWIARLADEEQRMVGRELHDVIGQQIAAIGMLGQTLRRKLEKRAAPEAADAERLLDSIEDAKREVRRLAEGLVAPREDMDLVEALGRMVEHCQEVYGIRCDLSFARDVSPDIGAAASHLVRIAQEAIRNAVEHGAASRIEVVVRVEGDSVVMAIEDDGRGLPDAEAAEGAGFVIMRQRADLIGGTIGIDRSSLGGVQVTCRVARERWGQGG